VKSIRHTKAFKMAIPVAELFPLFSPEGEKQWVPGWEYENVMGQTELSEDYVFLTKTHDHRTTDAIWIVKRYDPESHFVQYYKIEPGDKVGVVTVMCTDLGFSTTRIQVTYTYIAVSPIGERFIDEFTEGTYEEFIGEWQKLLSNYFQSRGKLPTIGAACTPSPD
jgi:hypothetical protein